MELYGIHGTFSKNVDSILKNDFMLSDGRCGKGVYFWKVIDNDDIYWNNIRDLTAQYFNHTKLKNNPDEKISYFYCNLKVNDGNFFDCESHHSKQLIDKFRSQFNQDYKDELEQLEKLSGDDFKKKLNELLCLFYNLFFSFLKTEYNAIYYVYYKKIRLPDKAVKECYDDVLKNISNHTADAYICTSGKIGDIIHIIQVFH